MKFSLRTVGVCVGMLVALFCVSASAGADTYRVTRTGGPDFGPCLPEDCSLREALAASNASTGVVDLILVPGSAVPYPIDGTLVITDPVEIRGVGADQVVFEETESGPVVANESPGVVLSGLTIANGAGGIHSTAALTLRQVGVEHNQGTGIQSSAPLTIDSSFIGFNSSPVGGAVVANAPLTVVNSTIAWNIGSGIGGSEIGGIDGNDSVSIASSAVVFNHSTSETAAGVTGAPLVVRDSIFAGNDNEKELRNCSSSTTVKSLGGNVEDAATCANAPGDRPNTNPGVDTLGRYGGTTLLYNLGPSSPAVDAATQCPPFDQRGVARPQGAACDSGPYELVPLPPSPPFADRRFFMRVGKKLRLRKKAIWVRLTCPSSEISPPCQGWIAVPDPPLVFHGPHTLQGRPLKGQFTLLPGKTEWVPVREPRGRGNRLPKGKGRWKVSLLVFAEDGAGNDWKYAKKRRVPLIRR